MSLLVETKVSATVAVMMVMSGSYCDRAGGD